MNFDIDSIKRKVLVKYPFFGSVVANVDYKINENVPTIGTDGEVIHYNPEFLRKLSVSEQTFVFAHEVCHIAFNHILRSEKKDPIIWNIATDAVINAFLKRDGLKMVDGGVDIADATNYDAEQLYEKLLREKKQQEQEQLNNNEQGNDSQEQNSDGQNNGGSSSGEASEQSEQKSSQSGGSLSSDMETQSKQDNNSSGSCEQTMDEEKQDVGHDTHSMWDEMVKKHKEQQKKEKESLQDKSFNKDNQDKEDKKSKIEKKQEEVKQLGEKETFKKNLEEKKKELENLKKVLAQLAMGSGSTTNGEVRDITDIGRAKPLIDWRYVLKEAIKYDVDWSYRNATIEDGVISANLEEQSMPESEIVLDTSGSVNEVLLKNFLRECKNILQHSRLKVGCFDTKFYGFHEIRTEEDIENMEFVGGGGTDFDVAARAFSRRVENKIIFTDGDSKMPDMSLDAIWIVFGGIKINPKGGKVIQIDEKQLNRLYSYQQDSLYKGRNR